MENLNAIIKDEQNMHACFAIKERLKENGVFNEEFMKAFYDELSILTRVDGYISTITIKPNYLKLTIRKLYFKKFNNSYNRLDYYPTFNQCILNVLNRNSFKSKHFLNKKEMSILQYNLPIIYSIDRLNENILIIQF